MPHEARQVPTWLFFDAKQDMRAVLSWMFTLMPLTIGLASVAILTGVIQVPTRSDAERKKLRRMLLFISS